MAIEVTQMQDAGNSICTTSFAVYGTSDLEYRRQPFHGALDTWRCPKCHDRASNRPTAMCAGPVSPGMQAM